MGDRLDHLQQAQHNEKLALMLSESEPMEFKDWVITVSFYSALHYTEAVFSIIPEVGHSKQAMSREKQKGSLHRFRIVLVDRCLPKASQAYNKLFDASMNVRYLDSSKGLPKGEFYSEDDVRGFIKDLRQIKQEILGRRNLCPVLALRQPAEGSS